MPQIDATDGNGGKPRKDPKKFGLSHWSRHCLTAGGTAHGIVDPFPFPLEEPWVTFPILPMGTPLSVYPIDYWLDEPW